MEIIFDQEYLSNLYYKGKSGDKRHRFQPDIIKKYIHVVDLLYAAKDTEELYKYNSLHYKRLQGDKKGTESVRINDQYRLEFRTEKTGEKNTFTLCNIMELSNHYQ